MPSFVMDNPNNPAKPTKSPKVLFFILLWPSLPENRNELIEISKPVPQWKFKPNPMKIILILPFWKTSELFPRSCEMLPVDRF